MASPRIESFILPGDPIVAKSPTVDNSSRRAVSWSGKCSSTPTACWENSATLSSSAASFSPLRRIWVSMYCAMSAARSGERQRRQKSSARSRAPARAVGPRRPLAAPCASTSAPVTGGADGRRRLPPLRPSSASRQRSAWRQEWRIARLRANASVLPTPLRAPGRSAQA
eukprot:scaffold94762_cov62-Phaeocystis_antarctica.AAC.6